MTRLDWQKKQMKNRWTASTGPFKLAVTHDKINHNFLWSIHGFQETIYGSQDLPILAMERAEEKLMNKLKKVNDDLLGR